MKVLDKGFVELVDRMGNDLRVCQAARVSTGASATKGKEKDAKLIEYLMKNKHWTPFEKVVFEFHVKAPIFVTVQWMRHRNGSFNQISSRYKEFEWEDYEPDAWRKQGDRGNIQGSSEENVITREKRRFDKKMKDAYNVSEYFYKAAIDNKIAREQARIVMPVAQYTEFFWTVNFRSLANFLTLRAHEHAQEEIRVYAYAIIEILKGLEDLSMTMGIFEKMMAIDHALIDALNRKSSDEILDWLRS